LDRKKKIWTMDGREPTNLGPMKKDSGEGNPVSPFLGHKGRNRGGGGKEKRHTEKKTGSKKWRH